MESTQAKFLYSLYKVERNLYNTLLTLGILSSYIEVNLVDMWKLFASYLSYNKNEFKDFIQQVQDIKNLTYNNKSIKIDENDLSKCIDELDMLSDFIQEFTQSENILPMLKEKYSKWLRPDLQSVKIIKKDKTDLIEIKIKHFSNLKDESIKRIDLSFITDGDYEEELMFPLEATATENSIKFVKEFDPYSIVMTGIGDYLFTEEAMEEVLNIHSNKNVIDFFDKRND